MYISVVRKVCPPHFIGKFWVCTCHILSLSQEELRFNHPAFSKATVIATRAVIIIIIIMY
jgi:hypothetical protein